MNEWIKKMWYMCTDTHTHAHTQWNTTQPSKGQNLAICNTDLEGIMLSEISQIKKNSI